MRNEGIFTVCRSALFSATVLLAGCGASHVGETWQCPLAQGAQCTSVAGADPAIREDDRQAALPPVRTVARNGVLEDADGEDDRACTGLCRPFGWLKRWLEGGGEAATADAEVPAAGENGKAVDGASEPASANPDPRSRIAAIPDTRVPERIGRVWIAPWVDDDGVYREGAWVRIVIRPGAWRIP